MTDTNQLPPLPSLQAGDSHMESLIEAAIQRHASTRDAMRWLVRQLVPVQSRAQLTQGEPVSDERASDLLQEFIDASDVQSPSFDAEMWIERVRAILALRPAAQTEREAHATARAFSLATMAAEEFVRCNGLSTGEPDEFMMTGPDLTDEHATACVDHLKWVGECVAFDTDDGVLVRLGDFTLGSLS